MICIHVCSSPGDFQSPTYVTFARGDSVFCFVLFCLLGCGNSREDRYWASVPPIRLVWDRVSLLLLLSTAAYTRSADSQASGESPVPATHLLSSRWYVCPIDLNPGPHTCTANTLHNEPSNLHYPPIIPFFLLYFLASSPTPTNLVPLWVLFCSCPLTTMIY